MSKNTNLSFLTDYITADITNGRIGINTPSPTVAFDVTGAAKFSGVATAKSLSVVSTNGYSGQIIQQGDIFGTSATNLLIQSSTSNGIGFLVNGGTTFNMFINSSGNIGIGTTSQGAKLELYGNYVNQKWNDGTRTGVIALNSDGADPQFRFEASNNFVVVTNSTERMRITAAGNVGIGTSSPGLNLAVQGLYGLPTTSGAQTVGIFRAQDSSSNISLDMGVIQYFGSWIQSINKSNSSALTLALNPNGGNVGIGTTTPGNFNGVTFTGPFFDVAGVMQIKGTSANGVAILQFGGDTYRKATIESSIGTQAPYLAFGTSSSGTSSVGTERMRITSGGDVFIGTTSSSYASTGRGLLTLNGSSNALIELQVGGSEYGYVYHGGSNGNMYLNNSRSNGSTYVITGGNGVYLSAFATSWTANSDIRLKNIISPIDSAVDKLSTLNPVIFSWKSDDTNKENIGLIAQDVKEVLPQVIDTNKDGFLGVRYVELVPVLVKAIQELSAEITILKNK